ncbi:hypothetical protein KAFR_0A02640 [Kazachstania africana CBS 2517]|uniref:Mitochondrial import inner membrane translocase subunit TIM44 n=1 Tax=Kazachstania africana (strain ATCC 22294 / BCRC 22015 / CBS 2517 / CECT 1963 / NBRC 1671 / NRRL Y-8276) TaxID=1071382 RepID=H2AMV0_KAZAF|nr:hypothetical protein KAFR_0A02640 [Kazachstania africana CBS 2517]CCF55700.1 hypothetical protein KAFR_0A02640 [Kazachstania africana CBS 2517]
MLVRSRVGVSGKPYYLKSAIQLVSLHTSRNLGQQQRTPLQIFRETFKKEWEKSAELQGSIKELQDASGKISESEAYKKARDAYLKAHRGSSTILDKTLKKTGDTLEDIATKAWESEISKNTRQMASETAKKLDESFEPVRNTKIYKDVSEVLNDDGDSYRYGGFIQKDERRLKRENALKSGKRVRAVKSNDEAGTALVATNVQSHESIGQKYENFKERTMVGKILHNFKVNYWDESENPLIVLLRKITLKITGFFGETESSRVYSQFKLIDQTFNAESFTRHLREYIVPEILEAYIKGDEKVLKNWFSEAPFNVYSAQQKVFRQQNLFPDGNILDIRNVEIVSAKLLQPQDIPVLVVSCRAQEINIYRKIKTGEVAAGNASDILMSTYAMVFTRDPEEIDNDETEGWRILEFVRGNSRQFT